MFAPICTPFAENEDVDYEALRSNVGRYAASGILGYLALGSNGENRSLSEDERLRVLEVVWPGDAPSRVLPSSASFSSWPDSPPPGASLR